MKYLSKIMFLLGISLSIVACSDEIEEETTALSVTTPVVSSVTATTAYMTATATGSGITHRGFCYSTSPNPTTSDRRVDQVDASMATTVAALKANTTYHVRAYAQSHSEVLYSDDVEFKTLATDTKSSLDSWKAPLYDDDYRLISTWVKRFSWNLANVHDPTVVKGDDGYYYMYCTDAGFGNPQATHGHFHCRRSLDLVNWEYMGAAMPDENPPAWVFTKLNEIHKNMGLSRSMADPAKCGYWAPCVRKVRNGLYRMYYAITVDGYINGKGTWSERAFIGMMETADLASNNWVDKGFVITNYSDKDLNIDASYKDASTMTGLNYESCYYKFNAIDPTFIITPEGAHWLIYGSWHSGFAAVQLNPQTGKTVVDPLPNPWGAENEAAYGKRIFTRNKNTRWQPAEAPEVIWHDGYYYLFMAYDALDVPYNTNVWRSATIDGEYTEYGGVLTHPYKFTDDYGWVGIGHCAVFDDGNGNYFYASQQRLPSNYVSPDPAKNRAGAPNAVMLGGVRSIKWQSNGWPVVMPERYAAVPQVAISKDDIIGKWEHIDLSYSYGNQRTAVEMEFAANGTVIGGPWNNASWSFDASTNTLTVSGVELMLQRECDWEASPRRHTIVYAGLSTGQHKSYWGKKK